MAGCDSLKEGQGLGSLSSWWSSEKMAVNEVRRFRARDPHAPIDDGAETPATHFSLHIFYVPKKWS